MHILRSAAVALAVLSLITCAEDPIGPAGGSARLRLVPVFGPYARVAPLVLDRVRIIVERPDPASETSDTIVDRVRSFDPDRNQLLIDDISIRMQVPSEDLQVTLQLLSGATLLFDGSQTVTVVRGRRTPQISIPVTYQGPGANVASLVLAPRDTVVSPSATVNYRLDAFDVQGAPVAQYYVSWSLTGGPAPGARINAAGRLTAPAANDTFYVKAVAPNGKMDSTRVVVGPFTPPAVTPVPLATGDDQSCQIAGGVTYCWGANDLGQLGDGTATDRLVPTPVAGGQTFVAVSAGSTHMCALTAAGQAFCWGDNTTGALGDGTTTDRNVPVAVSGGFTFAQIAAANGFTCAVTLQGLGYCWGANLIGQLGDGTTTSTTAPVAVAGGHSFTRISAAGLFDSSLDHACAIDGTGQAWCWGDNSEGQLGDGSFTDSKTPVAVTGGLSFSDISVGAESSCALASTGAIHCWGFVFGQSLTTPQPVAGGLTYTALDLGAFHGCGRAAVGWVCTGDNFSGQLGDGTTTARTTPVAPAGGLNFSTVAAGDSHTCGITATGTYCWGSNVDGQLGTGDVNRADHLTPTRVVGAPSSVAPSAGNGQTAPAGSTLPIAPAVLVRDAQANPIPGVEVVFAVTAGGGTVNDGGQTQAVATNASGIATVGDWTLGAAPGTNGLSATVSALGVTGNPVNFTATGTTGVATFTWTGATSTDWSVAANWSLAQVPGTLDSAVIGTAASGRQPSLSTTTVVGAVNIIAGGNLTINGQGLSIVRGLTTGGTGVLTMTNAADVVSVAGNAVFDGGNELNLLSAGGISIFGNLTQLASNSGESFHPSGTFITVLAGVSPIVSFATPGLVTGTSRFQELAWVGTGTLTLATPAVAQGTFVVSAGASSTISSTTGARLTVGDLVSPSPVVLNNVPLTLSQATPGPLTLSNVTFQNMPTAVSQLVVSHPGGTFNFSNLVFNTTPVAPNGFYLDVTDVNGPTADGPLSINMVTPTPATPGAFVRVSNGALVAWGGAVRTWTGVVSTDWSVAGNWTPGQVPTNGDDVVIPPTTNAPTVTTSCSARTLTVNATAVLTLGAFNCQVGGNVFSDGSIAGTGAVQIAATAQIRGRFPGLIISGPVTATGDLIITGSLTVTGATGDLTMGGHRANISGGLTTQSGATFTMTDPLDNVQMLGNALFAGGSTAGRLSEGVLSISGSFTQNTGAASFSASGNHRTTFPSAASRTISFSDPVNSHFQNLDVGANAATVTLGSNVTVLGQLISKPTGATPPVVTTAGTATLTAGGADVTLLTLDKVPLVLSGGTIGGFSNIAFQNQSPTGTQLTVNNAGQATPFVFDKLTFLTLPTGGGLYLVANDLDGPEPVALTINLTNALPALGGTLFQATNGAVVNWPSLAPIIWTGAVSPDWHTAGNWSPAQVPTATSNVTIPAGTLNAPTLSASPGQAADLTVAPGATLTLTTFALTATGNVDASGTIAGNSTLFMTGTGVTLRGTMGNLTINGSVTLNGNTTTAAIGTALVNGAAADLNLGGFTFVANNFNTNNGGVLTMTNPSDSLVSTGTAQFAGGSTLGRLTAGVIELRASLIQSSSGSQTSFASTGTRVRATGSGTVTYTFSFGGATLSRFQSLIVSKGGGAVGFGAGTVVATDSIAVTSATTLTGASATLIALRTLRLAAGAGLGVGTLQIAADSLFVATPANFTVTNTTFNGAGAQLIPTLPYNNLTLSGGGTHTLTGATTASGLVTVTGASASLVLAGRTLNAGQLTIVSGAGLRMSQATDSLLVAGDVTFSGGSTAGTLADGVLRVGGSFTQSAVTSVTSFAPSGTHTTVFASAAARTINFGSPGSSAAGSHFQNLDLSAATGGVSLTVNSIADGQLISSGAGRLNGGGSSLTARQFRVTGLIADNAPLILNEQGTALAQQFDDVTFQNFPATGARPLSVTGPGGAAAPRSLTFIAVNFPPLAAGAGNFYVTITSSNGFGLVLTMAGSNQGAAAGGNGAALTSASNGASVLWP